jgi:hypothetical protein
MTDFAKRSSLFLPRNKMPLSWLSQTYMFIILYFVHKTVYFANAAFGNTPIIS